MEAAGALWTATPILESIPSPPGGVGWSWIGCGCHKDPILDQIPTCLVPCIGGIELQLLCGVRILGGRFVLFPVFPGRGCYNQHQTCRT